jgi:hypothetical protein
MSLVSVVAILTLVGVIQMSIITAKQKAQKHMTCLGFMVAQIAMIFMMGAQILSHLVFKIDIGSIQIQCHLKNNGLEKCGSVQ